MTSDQRTGLETSPGYIANDIKITGFANPSKMGRP